MSPFLAWGDFHARSPGRIGIQRTASSGEVTPKHTSVSTTNQFISLISTVLILEAENIEASFRVTLAVCAANIVLCAFVLSVMRKGVVGASAVSTD